MVGQIDKEITIGLPHLQKQGPKVNWVKAYIDMIFHHKLFN